MSVISDGSDWSTAVAAIIRRGGLVLVLGAPDTGKTTFCRDLANSAVQSGAVAAIVDADIGQSEIGPPACVSFAVVSEPVRRLGDLKVAASAFVGSVAPQWALTEHLAATTRVIAAAKRAQPDIVICDTTGYADAPWSARLKRAKIEALDPDQVVFLRRERAGRAIGTVRTDRPNARCAEPLVRSLTCSERPATLTLGVPDFIVPKPPALRAQRRAWSFSRALNGAVARTWQIEDLVLEGTWLGTGSPLQQAALAQFGKEARAELRYAELSGRSLAVLTASQPDRDAVLLAARRLYGASAVTVTLAAWLDGLLVGLHDDRRTLLGIGLIAGFDERRLTITILTATHAYATTRCVRFGLARLRPNGHVTGVVRPGDV